MAYDCKDGIHVADSSSSDCSDINLSSPLFYFLLSLISAFHYLSFLSLFLGIFHILKYHLQRQYWKGLRVSVLRYTKGVLHFFTHHVGNCCTTVVRCCCCTTLCSNNDPSSYCCATMCHNNGNTVLIIVQQ
jgi:hypothetical protein